MKNIKKFISNFIQAEFDCLKIEYDFVISDELYEKCRTILVDFYHNLNKNQHWRGIEEADFGDFDKEEKDMYQKNSLNAKSRTLFQIKHYKNPKLGENLQKIVVDDNLYACYVSYPQKGGGRALYFSSIFFVAQTSDGLKIIYEMSFDADKGKWYHPIDLEHLRVNGYGKLVDIEKYQAPEEESSLADYNKD